MFDIILFDVYNFYFFLELYKLNMDFNEQLLEIEELKQHYMQKFQDLVNKDTNITELKDEICNLEIKNLELTKQLEEFTNDRTNIEVFKNKIVELEKTIEIKNNELRENTGNNIDIVKKFNDLVLQNKSLIDKINIKDKKMKDYIIEITNAKREIVEKDKEIGELLLKKNQISTDDSSNSVMRGLLSQLAIKDSEIENKNNQIELFKKENNILKDKVDDLTKRIDEFDINNELKSLRTQIEEYRKSNHTATTYMSLAMTRKK